MTIAVKKMPNGEWWGGRLYGRYVRWNRIYIGESAEVLELLLKNGALK